MDAMMTKNPGYFECTRKEILPLLPDRIERALEIGCGMGNTLSWLKGLKQCSWTGGVEIFHDAALHARGRVDAVYEGSIEQLKLPIEGSTLDLVLCLDVLEHLVDPWAVVSRLMHLLKPGGALIASIPNVRNRKVVVPLLLKGRWEYTQEGILDRTHLRFFTRAGAVELIESSGLRVDKIMATGLGKSRKSKVVNSLLPSSIRSFFEYQYLIRGIKL